MFLTKAMTEKRLKVDIMHYSWDGDDWKNEFNRMV